MRRKYLFIGNNSHYFNVNFSKRMLRVPNTKTFAYKSMQNFHLYIRSIFHYKGLETLPGKAFACFLTLTHNENSLPKYLGKPCFSRAAIDKLIHALRNRMQRNYSADFEYIVTKELGSKRNRPHYHAIFYIHGKKDKSGSIIPLKNLPCWKFVNEVKELWQGSPSEHHGEYKRMKYGLVHAGENFGELYNPSALSYVCKYALKDLNAESFEKNALHRIQYNIKKEYFIDKYEDLVERYLNENDVDNIPNYKHCLMLLGLPDSYVGYYSVKNDKASIDAIKEFKPFKKWLDHTYKAMVNAEFNWFLHNCSTKHQKSNKLGIYALDSNMINYDKGTILVQIGRQYKEFSLPLYLYRKLYYEKPFIDEHTGNVMYVRNDLGCMLLEKNFERKINRDIDELQKLYDFYEKNKSQYIKLYKSPVPVHERDDLRKVCEFNAVYRGRLYNRDSLDIDLKRDFHLSLISPYYDSEFSKDSFSTYVDKNSDFVFRNYLPYEVHPEFKDIQESVSMCDNLYDFYFSSKDIADEHSFQVQKQIRENRLNLFQYGRK